MFRRALPTFKLLRRFSRERKGVAALEFALVAVPFFLLIIGLAEIGMIGLAQTSLNFAISNVGRDIRTGQAQAGGLTYDEIQQQLCDDVSSFLVLSCEEDLFLDVDKFVSFVDADAGNPIQDNAFNDDDFGYDPGGPSDIVVVRAYYRWQILTPMFEPVFQNIAGGQRILASTMMFRNEPF